MCVDQYKIVISLLEFKQPGRSLQQTIAWCDVICAKRLIHKNSPCERWHICGDRVVYRNCQLSVRKMAVDMVR